MPSPTFRRLTALCMAAMIAVFAAGCGGKDGPTQPIIPELTQSEADDLVQQFAMMMASDHGGWMTDLLSTRDALPAGGPPVGPAKSLSRRLLLMPASAGRGFETNRDTSFAVGWMNYNINYLYTDTLSQDSIGTYNPAVVSVDAISLASGAIMVPGFDAFFRHIGDPITVTGLEADTTTLHFSAINEDSIFAAFLPVFRTSDTVYTATVSFLDYEIDMVRDPAGNPYPIAGEIIADIFSEILRTPNPNDLVNIIDGIITMTFDGTQTPLLDITNQIDNAAPPYRYRINLTTGAITRQP